MQAQMKHYNQNLINPNYQKHIFVVVAHKLIRFIKHEYKIESIHTYNAEHISAFILTIFENSNVHYFTTTHIKIISQLQNSSIEVTLFYHPCGDKLDH